MGANTSKELQNAEKLGELIITDKKLEALEFTFKPSSRITTVNLSQNKLATLPTEFRNLKQLTKLDISHNLFNELPFFLYNMISIEYLNAGKYGCNI
jgi:Leucine-rich repeat (LRR) protein